MKNDIMSSLFRMSLFLGIILMLTSCCKKEPLFVEAPESVMYYICSNCSLACDILIVDQSMDDDICQDLAQNHSQS